MRDVAGVVAARVETHLAEEGAVAGALAQTVGKTAFIERAGLLCTGNRVEQQLCIRERRLRLIVGIGFEESLIGVGKLALIGRAVISRRSEHSRAIHVRHQIGKRRRHLRTRESPRRGDRFQIGLEHFRGAQNADVVVLVTDHRHRIRLVLQLDLVDDRLEVGHRRIERVQRGGHAFGFERGVELLREVAGRIFGGVDDRHRLHAEFFEQAEHALRIARCIADPEEILQAAAHHVVASAARRDIHDTGLARRFRCGPGAIRVGRARDRHHVLRREFFDGGNGFSGIRFVVDRNQGDLVLRIAAVVDIGGDLDAAIHLRTGLGERAGQRQLDADTPLSGVRLSRQARE